MQRNTSSSWLRFERPGALFLQNRRSNWCCLCTGNQASKWVRIITNCSAATYDAFEQNRSRTAKRVADNVARSRKLIAVQEQQWDVEKQFGGIGMHQMSEALNAGIRANQFAKIYSQWAASIAGLPPIEHFIERTRERIVV
jgi:hypothetical protein